MTSRIKLFIETKCMRKLRLKKIRQTLFCKLKNEKQWSVILFALVHSLLNFYLHLSL
jgi:hypothetical protein